MNSMFEGLEYLLQGIMIPAVLALASTIARIAHFGWQSFGHALRSYCTSCFLGVVVFWGAKHFELNPYVEAALVAGASYGGTVILDAVMDKIIESIRNFNVPGCGPGGKNKSS